MWCLAYEKSADISKSWVWVYVKLDGLDDPGAEDQAQKVGRQIWSEIKAKSRGKGIYGYTLKNPQIVWMVPLKEKGD